MPDRTIRRLRAVPEPPGRLPQVRVRRIHGYDRAYRRAGEGPPIILIHGIGDSSLTWSEVVDDLAHDHDVIAPDLLGHGHSDKPRADYSIGGFANAIRDLMTVLDVERATIVGHSLGGSVAMQFAYQYPERCDRLVLVSSGSVSRAVNPMLRAATLPMAPTVMGIMDLPGVRGRIEQGLKVMRAIGGPFGGDVDDLMRVVDGFHSHEQRMALTRTLRAVIDARGQVVTAVDRAYLAADLPTLLVWGSRDPIMPAHHARLAHAAFPGSRLEVFEGAGHFPHRSDRDRFLGVLTDFLHTTEPSTYAREQWRTRLMAGRDATVNDMAEAAEL